MSSLARWSYVEGPATVWPYTVDEFGQPSFGAPYLIPAVDFEASNETRTDETGKEFVSRMVYYFEDTGPLVPSRNWYIKAGSHINLASPPSDAHEIKQVSFWPMEKFGAGEIPDYAVYT